MDEAATRTRLIDERLRLAGWDPDDPSQVTRGGLLPFAFYTNGHDSHFWESGFYSPERVYGFPTREELE